MSVRPRHHVGLPELPLQRGAGKPLGAAHRPHPSKTGWCLKRSQTPRNFAAYNTHVRMQWNLNLNLYLFGQTFLYQSYYFSHSLYRVFFQGMMGLCLGVTFLVGVLKS